MGSSSKEGSYLRLCEVLNSRLESNKEEENELSGSLFVSLNSRLESKIEEEKDLSWSLLSHLGGGLTPRPCWQYSTLETTRG